MNSSYRFDYAWLGGDRLSEDVTIDVADGLISRIGDGTGDRIKGVVLPGMVSAHSHVFHRALRGRTHESGGDFWAWREPMYKLASSLTPDSYFELAVRTFSEMLAAGITTVGEFHYVHHQPDGTPYEDANAMGNALLSAAAESGIRITLLDTLYLTSGVDGTEPGTDQIRFSDRSVASWIERVGALSPTHDRAHIGIAAHSVRAVTRHDLTAVADFGRTLGYPFHIHVAEQPAENEAVLDVHGVTAVRLLSEVGLLGSNTTLVHATHTTPDDRHLIKSAGSSVCLCPTTEADLGDGIGPAIEFASQATLLSLGTDSNAVIDPFEEMRRVEHHDRLRLGRRGVHSPVSLLQMATANGAASLGWTTGRLEVGAAADMVVIDPNHLDLAPFDPVHGLGSIVMAGTRSAISSVMVGGETVYNSV